MTALPKELNYAAGALASLPGGTNSIDMVVSPANGAVFSTDGASIAFDLPSRGYLQPGSMYLRYKCAVTGSGAKALMRGIPAYTPFVRSEIIIGWSITVQQYLLKTFKGVSSPTPPVRLGIWLRRWVICFQIVSTLYR